jgi:hypothetical protein
MRYLIEDMPDGGSFRVGRSKEGIVHLDWTGFLRREGGALVGEADHTWTVAYEYYSMS